VKRFKWTSITESEFERLVKRCNFTPEELQILKLRRKGYTPVAVGLKTTYCERQVYRISRSIVEKIMRER
jgi:DNA-binding NarL/FixJ family response regulator